MPVPTPVAPGSSRPRTVKGLYNERALTGAVDVVSRLVRIVDRSHLRWSRSERAGSSISRPATITKARIAKPCSIGKWGGYRSTARATLRCQLPLPDGRAVGSASVPYFPLAGGWREWSPRVEALNTCHATEKGRRSLCVGRAEKSQRVGNDPLAAALLRAGIQPLRPRSW